MASKWTNQQVIEKKKILEDLYVKQNLTIKQIGVLLNFKPNSIYEQLIRVGIKTIRSKKLNYNNQRNDIKVPSYSLKLAEFIGILLGDGHITPTQVTVTIGTKEGYTEFITKIIEKIFKIKPKVLLRENQYHEIYFGSTVIVKWLLEMGMVHNKVLKQVSVPRWCLDDQKYHTPLIRGLIDTDGSIYKIRSGIQISFTNKSLPLLKNVQYMLRLQGFSPSKISANKVYLTKKSDISKFVREIGFNNPKHLKRYLEFTK